jgi:hypothetical protein
LRLAAILAAELVRGKEIRPFDTHAHTGTDIDGTTRSSDERGQLELARLALANDPASVDGSPSVLAELIEECRSPSPDAIRALVLALTLAATPGLVSEVLAGAPTAGANASMLPGHHLARSTSRAARSARATCPPL